MTFNWTILLCVALCCLTWLATVCLVLRSLSQCPFCDPDKTVPNLKKP